MLSLRVIVQRQHLLDKHVSHLPVRMRRTDRSGPRAKQSIHGRPIIRTLGAYRPTQPESDEPLVQHGISDLDESSDVCTHNEIVGLSVFLSCLIALFVNCNHNVVQSLVHLFSHP